MDFINLNKLIHISNTTITSEKLIEATHQTNEYLINLYNLFEELDFNVFDSLGQRNLSGFIGEIYKNILANIVDPFICNPHPDGRPDILSLDSDDIKHHYSECFQLINNREVPIKSLVSPFKYEGLEVKCCIGESSDKQKRTYKNDHNGNTFALYSPRVGYLNNINWWAHHTSSSHLLGLYYDYYLEKNNVPQVLAAFYSVLSASDWNAVSTGKVGSKKTSNTSLNAVGKSKMKNNCMFYCNNPLYIKQFEDINITF